MQKQIFQSGQPKFVYQNGSLLHYEGDLLLANVPAASIDEYLSSIDSPGTSSTIVLFDDAQYKARFVADANITNGSNIVGSATIAFTSDDIGKAVLLVANPTGYTTPAIFSSKISSIDSPVQARMTTNASVTMNTSNARMLLGRDTFDAVSALLNAANTTPGGGTVKVSEGIYMTSDKLPVHGAVTFEGAGNDDMDWFDFGQPGAGRVPSRGTTFVGYFYGRTAVVDMAGSAWPNRTEGNQVARVRKMNIVGGYGCTLTGVDMTNCVAGILEDCFVGLASVNALLIGGGSQGAKVRNNKLYQYYTGNVVKMNGVDHIFGPNNEVFGAGVGNAGLYCNSSSACLIVGNQIFQGVVQNQANNNIYVDTSGGSNFGPMILGNTIETCKGAQIVLSAPAGANVLTGISVVNNFVYQNGAITGNANTYPVVGLVGGDASSQISTVLVEGNIIRGQGGANDNFKSIVDWNGIGNLFQVSASMNTANNTVKPFTGFVPNTAYGNTCYDSAAANFSFYPTVRPSIAVAYAATITPNFSIQPDELLIGTLTGALLVQNPSAHPAPGTLVGFSFVQDGTGTRAVTWGASYKFPVAWVTGGAAAAGQRSAVLFKYDGTFYWAQGANIWA